MSDRKSPGARFKKALSDHSPLQIVGTINAYSAMLAEKAGHRAIYLSGSAVASASCGLPDLGLTTVHDVLTDAERICNASDLPLLVDIDTGWGGPANIARSIRLLEKAGVAAVHIEDQIEQKRCGHRPGKTIVEPQEMASRIEAACHARHDQDFMIMARTDALATEGMEGTIERAQIYTQAGADALFPEAMQTLDQYREFATAVNVPVLANITEFGKTPLFNRQALDEAGIAMILYPLSAFRAMSQAALEVYRTIATEGDQTSLIDRMQTRSDLYEILNYHESERMIDRQLKRLDGED